MMDIKLNFVNRSDDQSNPDILVFQKNEAGITGDMPIAWTVIENCAPGWHHPFVFSNQLAVSASDSWGNYSPQLSAGYGQLFSVVQDPSGDILRLSGAAASLQQIDIHNELSKGAIDVNIYRGGKLLAVKTNIAPGQIVSFQFKPTIWIGVVSQVVEGQILNSAIVSQVNTEISLLGIASADIVLSGGGAGTSATAYIFTLENIMYA